MDCLVLFYKSAIEIILFTKERDLTWESFNFQCYFFKQVKDAETPVENGEEKETGEIESEATEQPEEKTDKPVENNTTTVEQKEPPKSILKVKVFAFLLTDVTDHWIWNTEHFRTIVKSFRY